MATYSNKVVEFDGVNEYVTMGDVLDFERTDPFSISFWVRVTTIAAPMMIVTKDAGSTTYRGYDVVLGTSRDLYFSLYSDFGGSNYLQVYTSSGALPLGWAHVCITYDGSSAASGVSIYVNGSEQSLTTGADTLSATTVNAANLMLGGRTGGGNYFAGRMDEAAVYNKELSASEVTWIYNSGVPRDLAGGGAPSNLVGWWRMGEGDTYPTLQDQTVNNYDGTMTNMESGDIIDDAPGGWGTETYTIPVELASPAPVGAQLQGEAPAAVTYYNMRGVDSNAGTVPPTYRYWQVHGEPDWTAERYGGPYSGPSKNITSVTVKSRFTP